MKGAFWQRLSPWPGHGPEIITKKIPVERGIGLAALIAAPFVAGYSIGYAVQAWQKGGEILPQLPVLETGIAAVGGMALTLLLGYIALATADSGNETAPACNRDQDARSTGTH